MSLRQRFQQWFQSRIGRRDSTLLTQRNVYILPTGPGFMLGVTLLVLLVALVVVELWFSELLLPSRPIPRVTTGHF